MWYNFFCVWLIRSFAFLLWAYRGESAETWSKTFLQAFDSCTHGAQCITLTSLWRDLTKPPTNTQTPLPSFLELKLIRLLGFPPGNLYLMESSGCWRCKNLGRKHNVCWKKWGYLQYILYSICVVLYIILDNTEQDSAQPTVNRI